jgi:hypothetical protein
VIAGDNCNYSNDDDNILTMINAVDVDNDVTAACLCVYLESCL